MTDWRNLRLKHAVQPTLTLQGLWQPMTMNPPRHRQRSCQLWTDCKSGISISVWAALRCTPPWPACPSWRWWPGTACSLRDGGCWSNGHTASTGYLQPEICTSQNNAINGLLCFNSTVYITNCIAFVLLHWLFGKLNFMLMGWCLWV